MHMPKRNKYLELLTSYMYTRVFAGSMEYMPETLKIFRDNGVEFRHGYVATPMCCPSRSSILTGLWVANKYLFARWVVIVMDCPMYLLDFSPTDTFITTTRSPTMIIVPVLCGEKSMRKRHSVLIFIHRGITRRTLGNISINMMDLIVWKEILNLHAKTLCILLTTGCFFQSPLVGTNGTVCSWTRDFTTTR